MIELNKNLALGLFSFGVAAAAAVAVAFADAAGFFDLEPSKSASCYLKKDANGGVMGVIVTDNNTGEEIYGLKGIPDANGVITGSPVHLNGPTGREKAMTVNIMSGHCDYFDGTSGEKIRYEIKGLGTEVQAGLSRRNATRALGRA